MKICIKEWIINNKVNAWFFTNVFLGLYPIILKLLNYGLHSGNKDLIIFVDFGDFLIFGLVLNMSNILYFLKEYNKNEKDTIVFVSFTAALIGIFSVLYKTYLIGNIATYDSKFMFFCTCFFILCTVFLVMYFLFFKELRMENVNNE